MSRTLATQNGAEAPVMYASEKTDQVWPDLAMGLAEVYSGNNMSTKRYMQLYTYVYNVCASVSDQRVASAAKVKPIVQPSTSEMVGAHLYRRLKGDLEDHVRVVLERGKGKHGEEVLHYFVKEWEDVQFCRQVINGIFSYLNRHWIKREIDDKKGNDEKYIVTDLMVVVWREVLFTEHHNFVTQMALNLIEKERNGECIEWARIQKLVACYIGLELDPEKYPSERDPLDVASGTKQTLRIYRKMFETDFIRTTEEYYRNECAQFLQNNSFTDYMKRVENRLKEEKLRCARYLHNTTDDKLQKTLQDVLIKDQLGRFHNEIGDLLENTKDEDVTRMYMLCDLVDNGLEAMRVAFEDHVNKQGTAAIAGVAEQAFNDPKLYVHTILTVMKRYEGMCVHSFKSETGFVKAFDKAATNFINKNAVTTKTKSSMNKCPELLARYTDILLRKSAKNPDADEMEEMLNDVMKIFKYLDDKDIFQKFYTKMLSKRLIADSSASEDSEASMLSKMKALCGFDYTCKLQRMFTDTNLSKELSNKYREHCREREDVQLGLDFSVMVLGVSSWPTLPVVGLTVPHELANAMSEFFKYYGTLHQGRKLTWIQSQSRGELTSTGFAKKYTFMAWSTQMSLLMLFNDQPEYTLKALAEALAMVKEQLVPVLGTLVKNDLVVSGQITNGEVSNSTPDDCVFKLNLKFASKKIKVDLSKTVMRVEQRKETEAVHRDVDSDRKIVIQAAIVRIMKTRKTSTHSTLIGEVLSQLTTRFKPKIPMIKSCIDILIEKEYLKRKEDAKDTYEYLA